MRSFAQSKCKFMRSLAMLYIHIALVLGLLLFKGANATTISRSKQPLRSGCPITATRNFFGKQMNYIGRSFTSGTNLFPKMFLDDYSSRDITDKNRNPRLANSLSSFEMRKLSSKLTATTTSDPAVKTDKNNKKERVNGPLEVIVLGLSHHNAVVDVREKLAVPEDQWATAAGEMCKYPSISEAAVLSTCNRFEVYIAGILSITIIVSNITYEI